MSTPVRGKALKLLALTALTATLGIPCTASAASASSLPAGVAHRSTLERGDHGPAVAWLQKDLRVKAGSALGTFGPLTLRAVTHFQRAHHLAADGVVGPRTWHVLLTLRAKHRSAAAASLGWVCPVGTKHYVSNSFGAPRPGGRRHQGDDVLAPRYSPIYAVGAGTIVKAATGHLAGLEIILRSVHGNEFFYAHETVNLVHAGQRVHAGQLIAKVGNTGDAAGGPTHLHFEYWPQGGKAVNPYRPLKFACG